MALRILLLVLLAGHAAFVTWDKKKPAVGIDFYHFWVPAQAKALSHEPLGSPYTNQAEYARVINRVADGYWRKFGVPLQQIDEFHATLKIVGARDPTKSFIRQLHRRLPANLKRELEEENRFLLCNIRRRTIDLTAPPLQYALLAFLPSNYGSATGVYGILQFVFFLLGVTLLWKAAGGRWQTGAFAAVALMVVYLPYSTDLKVGNFNSIHLVFGALPLLVTCGPLRRATDETARTRWGAVAFGLLALYALLKPNFALIGLGLVAHLYAVLSRPTFFRALAMGTVFGLLLVAWPCLYFGSASIWFDWWSYIFSDSEKLAYDVRKFNISMTLHCVHWFGGSKALYAVPLAVLTTAGFAVAMMRAPGENAWRRLTTGLARACSDPFAAASIGLVFTLVVSPLVWGHYTIVVLVALLWAMQRSERLNAEFWLFAVASVLYSRCYMPVMDLTLDLEAGELTDASRALATLAWIPLWLGLCLAIGQIARGDDVADAPAPDADEAPDARLETA